MIESRELIIDDEFYDMMDHDSEMVKCELSIISHMVSDNIECGYMYESELYDMLGMKYNGDNSKGVQIISDVSIDPFIDSSKDEIRFVLKYDVEED